MTEPVRHHDLTAWLRGEGFPETEEVYALMEELLLHRERESARVQAERELREAVEWSRRATAEEEEEPSYRRDDGFGNIVTEQ